MVCSYLPPECSNSIWSIHPPPPTVSHQILLEAIPTWNLIIYPICLSSFLLQSQPPRWQWEWLQWVEASSLPTYTAHLRGWTWWQPPPPRSRPCSSSGRPAPSGCPRCAASRWRWMFPGICPRHCPPSSSIVPEETERGEKMLDVAGERQVGWGAESVKVQCEKEGEAKKGSSKKIIPLTVEQTESAEAKHSGKMSPNTM